MTVFELVGYIGGVFNVFTYAMRTMIPLRIMAIASNAIFIVWADATGVHPVLVLHVVLLPLEPTACAKCSNLWPRSVRPCTAACKWIG